MINLELKQFQEKAVDFLYDSTTLESKDNKIIMHAPTGSGKTIILIAYIEKYISYIDDTVFLWITPGKGELEEQSKEKMEKFFPTSKTGTLNDALTNGFETLTTYFINWERITKKGNLAITESEKENLFDQIKKAHRSNKRFILIIDEEHLNNTSKAQDIITAVSAEYEIRVSATPVNRAIGKYYEIDEVDVIAEGLITRAMYINYNLDEVFESTIEGETELLIERADETRKEIQKAYIEENEKVRPLVLIQFPNMNDELIERVENKLNDMGYNYDNKLVASWFSADSKEDKNSKKLGKINVGSIGSDGDITKIDGRPLFLLFKQALATGWDCPRAKILVKLRENMSESFSIQTLGRLRRMPKAIHYGREILDSSFLYTFDEEYKDAAINMGAFETERLFLKEETKSIELVKEIRDRNTNHTDDRGIRNRLYDYFKEKYHLGNDKKQNKMLLENNKFIFGENIKSGYFSGRVVRTRDVSKENSLKRIDRDIEVNTHIHGIELQHNIDILKKYLGIDYAKTRIIFEILFRKDVGNKNYKLLNLNLKEFYAFIINNIDKLRHALIDFDAVKYYQESMKLYKEEVFTIPSEENYKYVKETKASYILDKNVYKEYNSSMLASPLRSMSERLFEKYCENNKDVKFIYKNGDSGINYMSIIYTMNNGVERSFYPDYIIELEDNTIWIIETKGGEKEGKSKNIDKQVENKFEQFKRFSEKHNYNFAFVRDIDGELFYNNTEYTEDMKNDNWNKIEEVF